METDSDTRMPPKLVMQGARTFANYARALIQYTWKGTDRVQWVEEQLEDDMKGKPGLSKVTEAVVEYGSLSPISIV